MSLDDSEQAITRRELRANLDASGLAEDRAAIDLGWPVARLEQTLGVRGSDPVDVWELRDYLEQTVAALGRDGVPFTVLTEGARELARSWFALREPPRHFGV